MILVSILLVLAPGILVWKLSGCQDLTRPRAVMKALVAILVDALLVLLAAWGFLRLLYSTTYSPTDAALAYDVGFIVKYGILTCGLAAGWAIVKAACAALWKKWRKHEK